MGYNQVLLYSEIHVQENERAKTPGSSLGLKRGKKVQPFMSTKAVANSYIKKKLWRIADDMHGADTDQPLLPTTDLQKYKTMLSIFPFKKR
jgi:hypothetical protein